MWLARDKGGELSIWYAKPVRDNKRGMFTPDPNREYDDCFYWVNGIYFDSTSIKENLFPEVTWENSPVELVTKL